MRTCTKNWHYQEDEGGQKGAHAKRYQLGFEGWSGAGKDLGCRSPRMQLACAGKHALNISFTFPGYGD